MLLETDGIPPAAHDAVLRLVHGQGAVLEQGQLRLLHAGPLKEVWPATQDLLLALDAPQASTP